MSSSVVYVESGEGVWNLHAPESTAIVRFLEPLTFPCQVAMSQRSQAIAGVHRGSGLASGVGRTIPTGRRFMISLQAFVESIQVVFFSFATRSVRINLLGSSRVQVATREHRTPGTNCILDFCDQRLQLQTTQNETAVTYPLLRRISWQSGLSKKLQAP